MTTLTREKTCSNCTHKHLKSTAIPCNECNVYGPEPFPKWEKEK